MSNTKNEPRIKLPKRNITLARLVEAAHANARDHGWYDGGERNVPELLALIHSEVSEALEDWRNDPDQTWTTAIRTDLSGKPYGLASELADVVIRVADLCGYLGIDLETAVSIKHTYNVGRPYRHGGKAA